MSKTSSSLSGTAAMYSTWRHSRKGRQDMMALMAAKPLIVINPLINSHQYSFTNAAVIMELSSRAGSDKRHTH